MFCVATQNEDSTIRNRIQRVIAKEMNSASVEANFYDVLRDFFK